MRRQRAEGLSRSGMRMLRKSRGVVSSAVLCVLLGCCGNAEAGQFHPNKSSTFKNMEQLFKVEYLDNASLTGFVAEDVVQLGGYYVSTRFGCVTNSKGHDWAQADGILGMGFPAAALRSVPFPLFWALTDPNRAEQKQSKVLENRIFTLMLSEDRGELVLGGHDPKSVQGELVTTPVRASPLPDGSAAFMHYMIDVQSLTVGGHELLQFKDKSIAIQAILDSGTSCLVVPDDTFEGGLLVSPFKEFQKQFGDLDEPMIEITIEGQKFQLPYDDYMVDDKPCVMKMKSTPRTFLLGDVFFRRMVVVHNLNNPLQPLITLGQRDPKYELTAELKTIGERSHVPLGKKAVHKPNLPESEHAVSAKKASSAKSSNVGQLSQHNPSLPPIQQQQQQQPQQQPQQQQQQQQQQGVATPPGFPAQNGQAGQAPQFAQGNGGMPNYVPYSAQQGQFSYPAAQQVQGMPMYPGVQQGAAPMQQASGQMQQGGPQGQQGGMPPQGQPQQQQAVYYPAASEGPPPQYSQSPMIQPQQGQMPPMQGGQSMAGYQGSMRPEIAVGQDEEPPLHNPSLGGGHRRLLGGKRTSQLCVGCRLHRVGYLRRVCRNR